MDRIIDIAGYLVQRYKEVTGEVLDEMKLHKLLYFMQRDSFAISNEPAFEGNFEGWKFGPVSPEVHAAFCNGEIIVPTKGISDSAEYIADDILEAYGAFTSWKLSKMSHNEPAWQKSRVGLAPNENGNRTICLEDIQEDAKRVDPYAWVSPEEDKLFYSESNMAHLRRVVAEFDTRKNARCKLAEVAN